MTSLTPSLYRVAVTVLVIALLANSMLSRLTGRNDDFANVLSVASIVAVLGLLSSALTRRMVRWREESLLLAFAVWLANAIEYALEARASWESQVRQCGMYLAFAVLALGTYLAQRVEREAPSP